MRRLKVLFTPSARTQFLAALAYIREDSPAAALALRRKTEAALVQLRDFPESGRTVPEFPDLPFREVLVESYRFFYRVKSDVVWVVGVWHDAQLPGEPEEPRRL